MVAAVTYDLRSGQPRIAASNRTIDVPTYQDPDRLSAWNPMRRRDAGRYTLWDHCFELPGQPIPGSAPVGSVVHRITVDPADKLDIYDYPGEYPIKREGEAEVKPVGSLHTHLGRAVFVGSPSGGIHIHGWPPCNLRNCVIVVSRWDEVLSAIELEAELSFSIQY